MRSKIALLLIGILLTAAFFSLVVYEPCIHTADYEELLEIDEIGDVLASRIIDYLEHNPEAKLDDLIEIKGIGKKRLKLIDSKYR